MCHSVNAVKHPFLLYQMKKVLDDIALMITTYQILVFSNLCPPGSLQLKYHTTTSTYSLMMIMSALMKFAII